MVPNLKTFSFEATARGIRASREEKLFMKDTRLYRAAENFESSFPNGIFAGPKGQVPNIRFKDMFEWCQEHDRTPESLTKEELAQFRIH